MGVLVPPAICTLDTLCVDSTHNAVKANIESKNQRQKHLKAKLNADRKVSKVRRLLKVRKREVKCRAVIEEEGKAETFIALAKGKCQAGSVTRRRRDLPS
jgi:hypothetical protein